MKGEAITYHLCKDIMRLDPDLENLWIEVKGRNKNHSYLVASIYQPKSDPASKDVFIDQLETILAQINNIWNGPIIIGGDTNIDTLKYSPQKERYYSMLEQFGIRNVVVKPTRLGKSSIDHLLTNIPRKVSHTDVIPSETVSDHDSPYMLINIKAEMFAPRYKYIRDYKHFNESIYI